MGKKKKEKKIEAKIEIPSGINIELDGSSIIVTGKTGSVKRKISALVNLEIREKEIILGSKNFTKRGKKIIGTYKSHIKNMINGAKEPYKYILKICSGHFPMNVSVKDNELVVKNFLGEKTPRKLKLKKGVNVRVEGDNVVIEGSSKEMAGQTASDIEILCKINNRDPRIFQDGIWIINKAGKDIK